MVWGDLPFVLLLSSFSQKVWDICLRWPSATAHQLHKLPPTERKGNLWEKPKDSRFPSSPYRKGKKNVSRHILPEICTTSPGCLAPAMLHRLLHLAKTNQKPCRTDSAPLPSLSTAPEAAKTTRKLKAKDTGYVLSWKASWRSRAVAMPLGTNSETCCKSQWLQQRDESEFQMGLGLFSLEKEAKMPKYYNLSTCKRLL